MRTYFTTILIFICFKIVVTQVSLKFSTPILLYHNYNQRHTKNIAKIILLLPGLVKQKNHLRKHLLP